VGGCPSRGSHDICPPRCLEMGGERHRQGGEGEEDWRSRRGRGRGLKKEGDVILSEKKRCSGRGKKEVLGAWDSQSWLHRSPRAESVRGGARRDRTGIATRPRSIVAEKSVHCLVFY
jgi:hypothetical protein